MRSSDSLILDNMDLPVRTSYALYAVARCREDLIQAGLLGLVQAARSYDPKKFKLQFRSYAYKPVRRAIIGCMRKMSWIPYREYHRIKSGESTPIYVWSLDPFFMDFLRHHHDNPMKAFENHQRVHYYLENSGLTEIQLQAMRTLLAKGGTKEAADELGVTQSYVNNIKVVVLKKIRRTHALSVRV